MDYGHDLKLKLLGEKVSGHWNKQTFFREEFKSVRS
jgi:hypothetical protein